MTGDDGTHRTMQRARARVELAQCDGTRSGSLVWCLAGWSLENTGVSEYWIWCLGSGSWNLVRKEGAPTVAQRR